MEKNKVLFIDSVHIILQERLEAMGYECDLMTKAPREEIMAQISQYSGIVIRSKFRVDEVVLDAATSLKWIARSGAGMENIDLAYAQARGIICLNSPEGNSTAVGEHAIGMLLSLFNKLNHCDREVREGLWQREENRGVELEGKTVGIIGYGNMGKSFAKRLRGFDTNVLAYDKYKTNYADENAKEVALNELLAQSEIISLHIPQDEGNIDLIDDAFFESVHHPFYLINTARGKVVKTSALVRALKNGKLLGACLDVLEYEQSSFEQLNKADLPPDFEYLVNSNKVQLSPHVAGWTVESYKKLSLFLALKIEALGLHA